MLGVLIGLLMPSLRGVLFGTLAAIPLSLAMIYFVVIPDRISMGERVPVLPQDWLWLALAVAYDWITFTVLALAAYGIKRAVRPRRAT